MVAGHDLKVFDMIDVPSRPDQVRAIYKIFDELLLLQTQPIRKVFNANGSEVCFW